MEIKKIKFWYNSRTAFESEVNIEISTAVVRYKTNLRIGAEYTNLYKNVDNRLSEYESLFVLNKDRVKYFSKYAEKVLNWEPYYGIGRCIDGVYWNLQIELSDGTKKEFVGENGKPDGFDEFVISFERLIKKPLSYMVAYRYTLKRLIETGKNIGEANDVLILFPSDYFDAKKVDPEYMAEYEAVSQIPELKTVLFNYDGFVSGEPLKIYPKDFYTGDCIYRGWMLTPEQYRKLYSILQDNDILLINTPNEYETCHLFPVARHFLCSDTPESLCYKDGEAIYWDIVNRTFKRFMVKDYVKSVKGTNFPVFFETPIKSKEMNKRISEFIELRGNLYTGGIVLKEYVDLKKYGDTTNEYRAFFLDNQLLSLCRNSNQSEACCTVPLDFVNKFNELPSNYYTVDFAELTEGGWIVIETGDGQVSGLSPNQFPFKYYDNMRYMLLDPTIKLP